MKEKWRSRTLKNYYKKVSGKNMKTTTNKKYFYKVSGNYVEIIKKIQIVKRCT